mmetsp:Transcript_4998/g.4927  ORF Transcript_4998/g.4927 Transcript_4998/m.4927 type:complete len:138 (-) Transcript_4998:315-728(-)
MNMNMKIKNTIDFGTITSKESIRLVQKLNVLVGVHGAGLIWSAFLNQQQHTTNNNDTITNTLNGRSSTSSNNMNMNNGLVEIFAGDRGPTNYHYHNLASLVDIQYPSTKMRKGSNKYIRWNEDRTNEVVDLFRSLIT